MLVVCDNCRRDRRVCGGYYCHYRDLTKQQYGLIKHFYGRVGFPQLFHEVPADQDDAAMRLILAEVENCEQLPIGGTQARAQRTLLLQQTLMKKFWRTTQSFTETSELGSFTRRRVSLSPTKTIVKKELKQQVQKAQEGVKSKGKYEFGSDPPLAATIKKEILDTYKNTKKAQEGVKSKGKYEFGSDPPLAATIKKEILDTYKNTVQQVKAQEGVKSKGKYKFGPDPPLAATIKKEILDTNPGFPHHSLGGNLVPPIRGSGNNAVKEEDTSDDSARRCLEMLVGPDGELPEKLRNIEPRLIEHISNEIMNRDPNVRWNDIAGLEHAKKCVTEMVIWPLLHPDISGGCRSPGQGLLLFGPPGTGKTMIGKAIAREAKASFFYISASSLTSKWIGEGEKFVRALFGVASCLQPAVIFVDEIESLLSQCKSEDEHESSRRLKTQFLIEMERFDCGSEQILLIGATNRPQEVDEAARRRLTKRLYVPLPSSEARACIVKNLLQKDGLFKLSDEDIVSICRFTEGYSGSDMKNLVKDASMGPLREAIRHVTEITKLKMKDMRPVNLKDFEDALREVRPSMSSTELGTYEDWNKQFGMVAI